MRALLLLHGAQLLEQLLQTVRAAASVHLQRPVVQLLELSAQLHHGLLAIGHQLLQVLVAQLLPGTTLASTLPAAFCLVGRTQDGRKGANVSIVSIISRSRLSANCVHAHCVPTEFCFHIDLLDGHFTSRFAASLTTFLALLNEGNGGKNALVDTIITTRSLNTIQNVVICS